MLGGEEAYILSKNYTDKKLNDPSNIDDIKKEPGTENLFNKEDIITGGYFAGDADGKWKKNTQYVTSNFISVEQGYEYKKTDSSTYCFWDRNKKYISGEGRGSKLKVPEGTSYITFAVKNSLVDTYKLMKKSEWVDEYVPYEENYVFGDKWSVPKGETQPDKSESEKTISEKDLFLRVPTPYDDGTDNAWATHQSTHPSVAQFDEEWNGYKYWMVHTPYPYENNQRENPCIAVSNNGIKWEEPNGVKNPIVDTPPGKGDYNSDGHMFYNDETKKLEMWYREVVKSEDPKKEKIIRLISSDGVNWGSSETMYTKEAPKDAVIYALSPSVVYNDGKYKMWIVDDYSISYTESSDNGETWSESERILSEGKKVHAWHCSVILHNGKYHMLNLLNKGQRKIRYSYSEPGKEREFSEETDIILSSGNEWSLDGKRLYRPTSIITDTNVIVLHGTVSQANEWLIHAQSGPDFYNLKPVTQRAFDFYGIE